MTAEEVSKLGHGLYVLTWKSGGFSLASVGSLYDGTRWFAASNWTSKDGSGIVSTKWEEVERAHRVSEVVPSTEWERRYGKDPDYGVTLPAVISSNRDPAKCWNCGGSGSHYTDNGRDGWECDTCKGTGITTTEKP